MAVLRAAVIIYSDLELMAQLLGLSLVGFAQLCKAEREGLPYPLLYASGVRYVREPPGSEVWQTPRASYASKDADCEDLAGGWRVPELWMLGETAAAPYVKRISPTLRHILVQRADGSIEDPSLVLGMHDRTDPTEKVAARAALRPTIKTPGIQPLDLLRYL